MNKNKEIVNKYFRPSTSDDKSSFSAGPKGGSVKSIA